MIYNIDYLTHPEVKIVSVKGYPTEEGAVSAPQGDDVGRCLARGPNDLASLGEPVLVALAAFKARKDQTIEAAPEAIWSVLNPPPKSAKKKTDGGLTGADDKPISSGTGDGAGTEKEKKMTTKTKAKSKKPAAKKKAAKAKTKGAKKSTGPRGEKTLKIKSMLERKTGCTRAQVLEATGWPTVSMQALAKSCGLKLRIEKVKGQPIIYFGS